MNTNEKTSYQYAFLDSGSGGLPYLAQLKATAPAASCVYLADTKHFPYGEKTREEVISFAVETVGNLLERFSPELVIVACNTISVAALTTLRATYSIPFVGTVPAIKLASAQSINRKIGLLATERTVTDPYTDALVAEFASDCEIVRIGDSKLISRIESELLTASREERIKAVSPSIEKFKAAGVDTIVLACTHFLHVSEEIGEVAGKGIRIIDSRDGVVHQALRLVSPNERGHSLGACYITGGITPVMEERFQTYAKIFGISWGGIL